MKKSELDAIEHMKTIRVSDNPRQARNYKPQESPKKQLSRFQEMFYLFCAEFGVLEFYVEREQFRKKPRYKKILGPVSSIPRAILTFFVALQLYVAWDMVYQAFDGPYKQSHFYWTHQANIITTTTYESVAIIFWVTAFIISCKIISMSHIVIPLVIVRIFETPFIIARLVKGKHRDLSGNYVSNTYYGIEGLSGVRDHIAFCRTPKRRRR